MIHIGLFILSQDQLVFGRQCSSKQDNVQVYEVGTNEMRAEYVNNISRTHFVIRRDVDGDVRITDYSSNGTWVELDDFKNPSPITLFWYLKIENLLRFSSYSNFLNYVHRESDVKIKKMNL